MAEEIIGTALTIVSLEFARANGLLRYFTGKLCKHGHTAERLVSNKTCMQCACDIQNRLYLKNHARIKARVNLYRANNKEKKAKSDAEYQRRNRDKLTKYYSERYYKKRDHLLEKIKAYRKARPGFSNEIGKAYEMRKRRAMPPWADRAEIRKIYAKSAELTTKTGIVHSVDHIIPLKGRYVCGLHVHWNLQVITKIENCRKATKSPEEWLKTQCAIAL